MQITIEIKNQYGNERIFPACPTAAIFAGIAGTKTLTRDNLAAIKALGYEVRIKEQTLE